MLFERIMARRHVSWATRLASTALCLPLMAMATKISASFDSTLGVPQVFKFTTPDFIYYSLCNSEEIPVFPQDDSAFLKLPETPLSSSTISTHAYEENGVRYAVIFYENQTAALKGARYICDDTGHYSSTEDADWTLTAPDGLSGGSATAVIRVDGGFKVYTRDEQSQTSVMRYSTADDTWSYDGKASQNWDTSFSLAAGKSTDGEITVINPRYQTQTIEAASLIDDQYLLYGFPVELWGSPTNATDESDDALQADSTSQTWALEAPIFGKMKTGVTYHASGNCSAFYIGSDARPHQVRRQGSASSRWNPVADVDDVSLWPDAASSNDNFGTASDPANDRVWLYYASADTGTMTQLRQSSEGTWELAEALPTSADSYVPPSESSDPASPSESPGTGDGNGNGDSGGNTDNGSSGSGGGDDSGLSQGAKIGIGVGVSVGALVFLGMAFYIWRLKKKSKNGGGAEAGVAAGGAGGGDNAPEPTVAGSVSSPGMSEASTYGKPLYGQQQQQDPQQQYYQDPYQGYYKPPGQQQQHQQYHELPQQDRQHEMGGDGQVWELGNTAVTHELPSSPAANEVPGQQPQVLR